jgi:hypothetical protein
MTPHAIYESIVEYLSWVPGQISENVDTSRLLNVVVHAQIARPGDVRHTLEAVVDDATNLFGDALFRGLSVKLLRGVLDLLSHHAATTPVVAPAVTVTVTTAPAEPAP